MVDNFVGYAEERIVHIRYASAVVDIVIFIGIAFELNMCI